MRSWNALGLWLVAALGVFLLFVLPALTEEFVLVDLTVYAALTILAMSLALVWGYCGILSLGQSVFFGIGGYAYAIATINIGDTTLPIVLAVALPMLFAALLGYFMFWGRISDVYLGVITLTVSLIFHLLINSMSGGEYKIGRASIGGYNGIPGLPAINVPGDAGRQLDFTEMYLLTVALALGAYFFLRWLLTTRFGRVIVSIRENEVRAELLGYDSRKYKLAAYTIGAGLAGMGGLLYASWGGLINPDVFGIAFSAQVIVWVIAGGLGTLIGPAIGVIAIHWLVAWLGKTMITDANIILGALFVLFVLLAPAGLLPTLKALIAGGRRRRTAAAGRAGAGPP